MIAFIHAYREAWGEPKTGETDVDRLAPRARRDAALRPEVERVWEENLRVHGVLKVWRQLSREAIPVARLMKQAGAAWRHSWAAGEDDAAGAGRALRAGSGPAQVHGEPTQRAVGL